MNQSRRSEKRCDSFKARPLRVFICGPHSTGKTTLVNLLEARNPKFEKREGIARQYLARKKLTALDVNPNLYPEKFENFQKDLMSLQCELENHDRGADKIIIYDRGPDPLVYITKYHKDGVRIRNEMMESTFVKDALKRYRESIVILLRPQEKYLLLDGVRMISSYEELLDLYDCFRETLEDLKIPFTTILEADSDKRIALVEKIINSDGKTDQEAQETYDVL